MNIFDLYDTSSPLASGGLLSDTSPALPIVAVAAPPATAGQAQSDIAAPDFNFAPSRQQQNGALFSSLQQMGAAMLTNNRGPGALGRSLGSGLAMQGQSFNAAMDRAQDDNIARFKSDALRDDWKEKQAARARGEILRTAMQKLDWSQPGASDAAANLYIQAGDPDTALKIKEATTGKQTDAQRNYQYLISNGVPPDKAAQVFTPFAQLPMQYVPGNDYKPSGVFNPRTGQFMQTEAAPQTAPVDSMAPWAGLPQKQADEMRQRIYVTESKKLDDLRAKVASGRQTLDDLNRFSQLNQETATGGVQDRWLPNGMTFSGNKQQMLAIQSKLAPQVRPAGSGSTSDKDMALYLQALPGIDKPGDVNGAISKQYRIGLAAAEKQLAAAEQYFARYGHLNGFEQSFSGASATSTQPQTTTKTTKPAPPTAAQAFGSTFARAQIAELAAKMGVTPQQAEQALKAKGVRVQ